MSEPHEPRDIRLQIRLAGGHQHEVTLREDAPELMLLFSALFSPGPRAGFVQLPLDGGAASCSLRSSEIVSIISEPPVVVDLPDLPDEPALERPASELPVPPSRTVQLRRARYLVIDDFLSLDECRDILSLATASEGEFEAGTVTSYDPEHRQNLNIPGFGQSAHARLLQNRLLVWCPLIAKRFGLPVFPMGPVECQLTAAGDGQFFRLHADGGQENTRVFSCIYYFHREPRGFAGGELRLYDALEVDGVRRAAETFEVVNPVSNRMVVFASDEFHEAMPVRCPSGEFVDYRFAVTTWLHRSDTPDPNARFGWGHFRCCVPAPQFATSGQSREGRS